jgi:virulence factor Mce-like protein
MVTQAPSARVVAVTTAFALSCIGLILFVWSSLGGPTPLAPHGYRIHALFADASQLSTNADIRIAGVTVGKVVKIRQVGLNTDATLEFETPYAPLHTDARAILRQKTLLGETFVAMTPGSKTATPIADGGRLAQSQIGERQPLDRLLAALDPKTRHNLQAMLTGSKMAFHSRGRDLSEAFGELDPATESLAEILRILDAQQEPVQALVRDTGTVLDAVADRRSDVQTLIRRGDAVLAATARRDRAVTETVRAFPGLVRQLQSTMRGLDTTSALATPALRSLRPVARDALPALRGLDAVAPKATRLFRSFEQLLPTARKALPATAAIVNGLVPFSDALYPTASNIIPVIELVNAYKKELIASAANVGAATNAKSEDSLGRPQSYLRFILPVTEEGLVGYEQRLPSNRHNAYPAPGSWASIGREGLASSDCRNLSNPQTFPSSGSAPCRVQQPWEFGGVKRYFPHVDAKTP